MKINRGEDQVRKSDELRGGGHKNNESQRKDLHKKELALNKAEKKKREAGQKAVTVHRSGKRRR